jgi:hypothetical protein
VLLAVGAYAGGHFVSSAQAGGIPYPDPTTINPVIYTFTATSTGDVTAVFYGLNGGASYIDSIGMTDGGSTPTYGLPNHSSSVGESFDLGSVTAGDVLTFVLNVDTMGINNLQSYVLSSNPSLNPTVLPVTPPGGHPYVGDNQVYATDFTGDQTLNQAGVYLGWEDGTGYTYTDKEVVLTNVSFTATPLPAALPLFAGGLGLMSLLAKRRKQKSIALVAVA